jgi:hypothetical protein
MYIPQKIRSRIEQNTALEIEWVGHRDSYEIMEEWGDSIFWIINIWIGAYYLSSVFDFSNQVWWGLILLTFICTIPAWYETERWLSEYHIVCRNADKGGGVIFKAWGILGLKMVELDVSKASPAIDEYINNPIYWLWKLLTNHPMERVSLSSADHVFLNSSRMSPKFYAAISRVKSPISGVKREESETWFNVDQLHRLVIREMYDAQQGKQIIRQLVDKHFYG